MVDDTQCRFNLNSFKMVYVVNSESCLYKRNALDKARQVLVPCKFKHNVFMPDLKLFFVLCFSLTKRLRSDCTRASTGGTARG